MNSRKLVGLFLKTLLVGGITGLVTSFFVNTELYVENVSPFNFMELLGLLLFYVGFGLLASIISQTGFFAYLYVNQFGLGIFRSFWPTVQILLVAFVVFDLVFFPYKATEGEVSIFWYILMSASILLYGWVIAKIKAKQTNQSAFVPALFLMVVITTIEWVPGLRTEGTDYAWLMIIPLLACNTYQLLILHHLTNSDSKNTDKNGQKEKSTPKKNLGSSKA
ncbi:KinB-signaling pathway activation protein [Virgibacillus byunsanensis]|uniref:KinB-signaling pathway activation protein n=1 Tax=Virgibacillus byunsanensis TaxID=570945 RepID=A0ABW3LP51_9BACI